MHFYTVHTCIYELYCHVMNTDFVISACLGFLQKPVHDGGHFFFFKIENTLVILVCFLGHHLSVAHSGIRGEAWGSSEEHVCVRMSPAPWPAVPGGGRGERGPRTPPRAPLVPVYLSDSAWVISLHVFSEERFVLVEI